MPMTTDTSDTHHGPATHSLAPGCCPLPRQELQDWGALQTTTSGAPKYQASRETLLKDCNYSTGAAMSQFCTMTTSERKLHAAAICREVQGHEDAEMDLGKKVSVPKDIMLEELSLSSNRGSRLFKMRQRRSEKYTFETVQNSTNMQLNGITLSPSENEESTEVHCSDTNCADESTEQRTTPNPDSIASGYGVPVKDVLPEKFNSVPKSYHSPWEQAIISDPALADTLHTRMPDPDQQPDRPVYKCFNRVATPFGGFSRTCSPVPPAHSLPLDLALPDFPELQAQTFPVSAPLNRPSFNRAAAGWVSSSRGPAPIISISHPDLVPESDDL